MNWKKAFDKKFDQYNPIHDKGSVAIWCGADYKEIKAFIQTLLEKQKGEMIKKLIGSGKFFVFWEEKKKNKPWSIKRPRKGLTVTKVGYRPVKEDDILSALKGKE